MISLVINLSLFCLNITFIKSWTYLFRFKHVLAKAFWFKLFYLIAKHSLNEQYVFLWNQHVKYCKLLSEIILLMFILLIYLIILIFVYIFLKRNVNLTLYISPTLIIFCILLFNIQNNIILIWIVICCDITSYLGIKPFSLVKSTDFLCVFLWYTLVLKFSHKLGLIFRALY